MSYPLIFIVATWAAIIFLGYGLTSKANTMTFLATFIGACAIGTAFFLILDLTNPYSGVFRVSPAPLLDVIGFWASSRPLRTACATATQRWYERREAFAERAPFEASSIQS